MRMQDEELTFCVFLLAAEGFEFELHEGGSYSSDQRIGASTFVRLLLEYCSIEERR
jgi:hypothetical protein